ncbi:uncharacterized protein LOC130790800 [Actinidia eriantha]|uniref:uncharacterized protein LOC130790800 n=1 Tax=Actinidia eriantha TaxID=165200 RepID=UPI002584A58A|nr:uncharacterized protein LOC130790800 [Actinidia eriantha]
MNSVFLLSSPLLRPPALHHSALLLHLQPHSNCCFHNYSNGRRVSSRSFSSPIISFHPLHYRRSSIGATAPSNEGAVSAINFEDFVEKDWSFLDPDDTNVDEEHKRKIDQIISAGEIQETSKVLISIGSEGFVDEIVNSSPCKLLFVVHDSLLVLASIKEKYDMVKCWQGELIYLPQKWAPFDVLFLYFLPALPFELDQIFGALEKRCLPGARIVISHPQGRELLEQQRRQFPDVVISDMPDKMTLQNVAADHSFEMIEFVDEPGFYLAVLKFKERDSRKQL